jgi:serine/threonine protein kinase
VKPDNFLFLNSNEHSGLRAIDFGLAEYCEPGQYLTDRVSPARRRKCEPNVVQVKCTCSAYDINGCCAIHVQAGTVIYIAPEVLRNKYTLSADLWSVGIIAYLLLTGRLPFAGEEGEEVSDLFIRKQTFQNRVRFITWPSLAHAPTAFKFMRTRYTVTAADYDLRWTRCRPCFELSCTRISTSSRRPGTRCQQMQSTLCRRCSTGRQTSGPQP